ncbi:uncharacterized protein LOC128268554 [Anopheles cruzii]|uniref:uncharacterized protein LOC128268554 n=1 Tax=Anopheles cruzii TaxID=68878 RepID=UPI0022EC9082|nr:uncharacterized protein LOC128268554 [Anopheles cruzii]
MHKMIALVVLVTAVSLAGAKPEPKPDILVDSVPVVAAAPAVASYATFYEQTFHGNLAPGPAYVAYATYSPYVASVPVHVGASILLKK